MAEYPENLEEQLRMQKQRAAAPRRRRRIRRAVPIVLLCVLVVGLYLILRKSDSEEPVPAASAPPSDSSAVIAAVGDIALTEQMVRSFKTGDGYDFTACFENMTAQIAGADLAIGNLEGNVSETVSDHVYPPELLDALAVCGFDVLQTANSYSIQNGISGLARTKEAIQAAGMEALGTFSTKEEREQSGGVLIKDVNGIRFAFLSLTKGLNNLRVPDGSEYCVNLLYSDYDTSYSRIARDTILSLLDNAKAQEPDVIIAMVHWGSEYTLELTSSQKSIAELLLSNGADAVIGSHSHLVGPIRRETVSTLLGTKERGLIAYSLGDFLSTAERQDMQYGCVLRLEYSKIDGSTSLTGVSYSPTYTVVPSEELETKEYAVCDVLDAIRLFEQEYYDRIPRALYELLITVPDKLKEQTESEFQRQLPEDKAN